MEFNNKELLIISKSRMMVRYSKQVKVFGISAITAVYNIDQGELLLIGLVGDFLDGG